MKKGLIKKGVVSLCILLVLFVSLTCIILRHGMGFDDLTIGRVSVSHFTLVWNEKLELQIDSILISKDDGPKQVVPALDVIKETIFASQRFIRIFSRLNIDNLSFGEENLAVTLLQEDSKTYALALKGELIDFRSRLVFHSDTLVVEIIDSVSKRYNSTVKGQVRLEAGSDTVTGTISAHINGSFPVSVEFIADSEQISFKGKEAGQIGEITSLVDLFGLSHNIQRWITDYLSGSRYHLKSFKGQLPWDNPGVILDTLEAEVRVDDTEYVFAQGFEPIKGKYTDVFFSKGVLAIKPHNTTFYGQDGGESWLDINFNDPSNIILTAYIKTDAVANDDILNLLNHYHITLPFKQVGGTTDTDLRLVINLKQRKVKAEGKFTISEGLVSFDGTVFKVNDARILFVDSDVTLESLKVGFKDMFVAQVTGTIQAKKRIGDLDILLEGVNLNLKDSVLNLDNTAGGPQATYHFDDSGHVLEVGSSSWQLDSKRFEVGSFRVPVNFKDYSMELPPVRVDIPPGIQTELSGFLSIKKKKAETTCNLLKYEDGDLVLLSPHLSVDIEYDQGWVFRSEETAYLSLNKIPVTLYPSEFQLDDEFFRISHSRMSYGSFFDSHVSGKFDHQRTEGTYHLKNININNKNLEKNIRHDDETLVKVRKVDGEIVITCPELDLRISSDEEKNWSASFGDLSTLYSRSSLLQRYKINAGSMVVSSVNGNKPYSFSADIPSPYPLLIDGDAPVENLNITGKITDQGVTAIINKDIQVEFADSQLRINSNRFAFDVPVIISLVKDLQQSADSTQDKNTGLFILLNAENSHLYLSPNSKILADQIGFEYINGTMEMKLTHGQGKILMKVEDGSFLVDGSNLEDSFMSALIKSSSFQGGKMSIAATGDFDEYSVLLEIKDTVLLDLTTLNNVMALLNTVPALVTFSLPEYDFTGLPVNSALVGLKFKNKIATFESMEIISPSMQAAGVGWIDFSKKLIDLDVNLTTQKKINMRKVPIAGYILEGDEDETSMTIKIEGGLDDPDVSHTLLRDIVARPFNVLIRVLKLPVHMFEELDNESEN